MFIKSNKDERLQKMLDRLQKNTSITMTSAGGIARSMLEIFNEEFDDILETLDLNLVLGFLSTSSGVFLDYIGALLNCSREANETDDNYKYRISQQVNTVAAANQTAIRLKVLAVSGVKDVILNQFEKGAGTFTVYVVSDEIDPSQSLLDSVKAVVDDVKGFGIYSEVKGLDVVSVNIKARLVTDVANPAEILSIQYDATTAAKNYLNNIIGTETAYMSVLSSEMLNSNSKIRSVEIVELLINNEIKLVRDFSIEWNQRVSSTIEII